MSASPADADALLAWFDVSGRHDLPWQHPRTPYRVWLSEIMLQQTTVAAVGPYFRRFLERWPHVEALAAAPDEEIMRAWAGLGYYSRARNLLACARAVAARGGFPQDEAALRALPACRRSWTTHPASPFRRNLCKQRAILPSARAPSRREEG